MAGEELLQGGTRSVILFLSNQGVQGLYWGRIEKYLQPDKVSWAFCAETAGAFEDITRGSADTWALLLTDSDMEAVYGAALERFAEANPQCAIVVLLDIGRALISGLPMAILLHYPADIDDWLLMMHQLLN